MLPVRGDHVVHTSGPAAGAARWRSLRTTGCSRRARSAAAACRTGAELLQVRMPTAAGRQVPRARSPGRAPGCCDERAALLAPDRDPRPQRAGGVRHRQLRAVARPWRCRMNEFDVREVIQVPGLAHHQETGGNAGPPVRAPGSGPAGCTGRARSSPGPAGDRIGGSA